MTSIKSKIEEPAVIFFDLGKVLVDYDFEIIYDFARKQSKLTVDEFNERVLVVEDLNIVYETGGMGSEEFFQRVVEHFEFAGSRGLLARAWSNIFKPIEDNIRTVRTL